MEKNDHNTAPSKGTENIANMVAFYFHSLTALKFVFSNY